MTQRPQSPQTPASKPSVVPTGNSSPQDRAVLTTPQLADRLEEQIGYRLDEMALERVLIELDRHGYVEWEGLPASAITCGTSRNRPSGSPTRLQKS
ncbi:hypothetical protein ACFQMM_00940 [Saliphagus sp. GCM10025308]